MNNMSHKTFSEININDDFFQSLKDDYPGFEEWFHRKSDQDAFVQYDGNNVVGFLYLKVEKSEVNDVRPLIREDKILKVGTFKIDAHGTKLGEQFLKVIADYAINEDVDVCYVTIYPKHSKLIQLVEQFGFEYYGKKGPEKNEENVYLKRMRTMSGDINKDFPRINVNQTRKYLMSIYPKYHSVMFPDSILTTENKNIITDISFTNSIHKIYVCSMRNVEHLRYGDVVVLYRTAEYGRSAEYSAVATSVCVVEEVKMQGEFASFDEFYKYASQYSVFDKSDLYYWYNRGGCKAIKLTYNAALKKRIVRHDLIEQIGMERDIYWGFFRLSDEQFAQICEKGEVKNYLSTQEQMF